MTAAVNTSPNIILVFVDDMGLADIGYNADLATRGTMPTAVLDSVAAEGTIFTRFYSTNLCTPSRAALMTGRYPSRTNMKSPAVFTDTAIALGEDEQLLPEILKDLGYQTHMVGKWNLGQYKREFTPVGRGFDSYCGNFGAQMDFFYHEDREYDRGHSIVASCHDVLRLRAQPFVL